jgi:hypothetical protein
LAVTSNVGNRGRALGVVIAMAMVGALLSAQTAFGAGDPVASGTFSVKYSSGFKHQLKSNGVKLKPKKFKIKTAGSSVDPVTGAGTLKLGKITFKKGSKKVVYSNAKATLGANGAKGSIKGSTGKLFSLKGGTVTRNGFGATISGVKVKLLKGAAKKINRKLGLHSLHKGSAGKLTVAEQPETVAITSGFAYVDIPNSFLPASVLIPGSGTDPNTVAAKQPAHCIGPADGVVPIAPGHVATTLAADPEVGPLPTGIAARFKFPVTGGTISPAGSSGVPQLSGGVRILSGYTGLDNGVFGPDPASCADETPGPTTSRSIVDNIDLAPNLGLLNVQATSVLGGLTPGCTFTGGGPSGCGAPLGGPGNKGVAIGQTIDISGGLQVTANPAAKTVKVVGGLIKNTDAASLVLNGMYPNASGNAASNFVSGDKFGISTLQVNTR